MLFKYIVPYIGLKVPTIRYNNRKKYEIHKIFFSKFIGFIAAAWDGLFTFTGRGGARVARP